MMKKVISALLIGSLVTACTTLSLTTGTVEIGRTGPTQKNDQLLREAFEQSKSNLQIQGQGTVIRILSDDVDGSKHQRFILQLSSGQTLLIAHNIDLAPRVVNLSVGDSVAFNGEYEWNPEGGVIHWTHHDPAGEHVGGWIYHNGTTYQ